MTRRADYTSDEWAMLTNVVELVGLGMLAVSKSGLFGKLRELTALSICLTPHAVPIQFKRNELVLSLLEEMRVQAVGPFSYLSRGDVSGLAVAVATARRRALASCARVAALLATRTSEAEADGVKRWLLRIARRVAEASGDRWLGLGRKVSAEEVGMLSQIATALQISLVAPVPTASELEVMLGLAPQDADGVSSSGDGHERRRGSDK